MTFFKLNSFSLSVILGLGKNNDDPLNKVVFKASYNSLFKIKMFIINLLVDL